MIRVGASAPGKALLCGEYAVLDGAPAVVAAVGRRAIARWSDGPEAMSPEVAATLERARALLGDVPGSLTIDATELRRDDVKLGLGSSAAGAAASAAAVFASHGEDLRDESVRSRVFECALAGHEAVAPSGSGVDVVASTFGGFRRFGRDPEIRSRALSIPDGLHVRLVWTGHAARTSDLVAKVRRLEGTHPKLFGATMGTLARLAEEFADAFERGSTSDVVELAGKYGAAMGNLGNAASAPIVEERLAHAARLAKVHGGAAKPCGAGGGDVAIAFFADAQAANAFELACGTEGLHPIDVSFGEAGVQAQ